MLTPHRSVGALPLEAARRWRQGERLGRRGRDALGLAADPIDASTRRGTARENGKLTKKNAQVQDAMGEAARVANERIDTANRGKKMLDEGGPDVELKLRCKRQCRKTVEDDGKQVRALDQLARDYDDAISKLKASLTTEALQPEEKYDFEQLVGLYEERKAACERASAALANLPPPSPFISQEEEDAIRMLAVKDKYQVAQREASNLAADASAAARAATS